MTHAGEPGLTAASRLPSLSLAGAARLVLFVGACAVALYLIDPWRGGPVGFDAAASVLYFDRLVQGRHLEAFISATPKPLLTFAYGLLYHLTGDWRLISLVVIAVFGLSAVLASELAGRIAGLPAAVFAGVAVVCSPVLMADVGVSYAVVWAFAACLAAGLAITTTRPHYGLAGLALGVAVLARFEVLIILGLSAVVLAGAWSVARHRQEPGPPRDAWLCLAGFLAVPIQFTHDWLLTGNPLYAEHLPGEASLGLTVASPMGIVAYLAYHILEMGPLLALAVLGAAVLFRRRRWGILVGIGAMTGGVAAFLVVLAIRRTYVSSRYIDPIELAILAAAAVGFGALTARDLAAIAARIRNPTVRLAALAAVAGIVASLVSAPLAIIDKPAYQGLRTNVVVQDGVTEATPALRQALAAIPGVTAWPGPTAGQRPALFVPVLLRPQLAVDLGIPIGQVQGTVGTGLATNGSYPMAGQIVFHDKLAEPAATYAFLEVIRPTTIGRIIVTPLLADPARGVWVVRIDPAP